MREEGAKRKKRASERERGRRKSGEKSDVETDHEGDNASTNICGFKAVLINQCLLRT